MCLKMRGPQLGEVFDQEERWMYFLDSCKLFVQGCQVGRVVGHELWVFNRFQFAMIGAGALGCRCC